MFHGTKCMNYMLLSIALFGAASYQSIFGVTREQHKENEIIKLNIQKMQQAINALNEDNKGIDVDLEKVNINSRRGQLLKLAYSGGFLSLAASIISTYFNISNQFVITCFSVGGVLLLGTVIVDGCRVVHNQSAKSELLHMKDNNNERIAKLGLYRGQDISSNQQNEQE